jgi:Sec-independent protein translocase protein TatA
MFGIGPVELVVVFVVILALTQWKKPPADPII